MKAVDFYKLPRAIQDRFVGSVMSGFPPAPILAARGATSTKYVWLGTSAVSFVAMLVVARLGYGSLDSALSLHSPKAIALYIVLLFGIVLGLLMAWARLLRERALPYSAGVYLFPSCIIDARSESFRIYDTKDLASVTAIAGGVKTVFAGGPSFVFHAPGASDALAAEVQGSRDRALHARATEDPKELVAVDPLHNPRFSSPVGPREPYAMRLPPWGKFGWAVAGFIGIVVGPVLLLGRNAGSDKKMYSRAIAANDTASYRLYLDHGKKYADEIRTVRLPLAELHDAEQEGTVDALLKFKVEHPGTQIKGEMESSIRSAMLVELDKAKAPGTLAALQEFARRYPEHGVDKELREASHAIYARELAAYTAHAPKKDKNVVPFVERLFAWAEKHGPKVQVRFRRRSFSLERADQFILKTPTFMGVVTYPSHYFDDKHAQPREDAFGKAIVPDFQGAFSKELFAFETGPIMPDTDAPSVSVPTLIVAHSVEWSGHTYVTTKPRGSFVGLNFVFDATFVIPNDNKPFTYHLGVFKHAATNVFREVDPVPPPGQAEELVYDAMATAAFDEFERKVSALFVTPPVR